MLGNSTLKIIVGSKVPILCQCPHLWSCHGRSPVTRSSVKWAIISGSRLYWPWKPSCSTFPAYSGGAWLTGTQVWKETSVVRLPLKRSFFLNARNFTSSLGLECNKSWCSAQRIDSVSFPPILDFGGVLWPNIENLINIYPAQSINTHQSSINTADLN